MQTFSQRKKKRIRLPGGLVLVLVVSLCLLLTATSPGNYRGEDPPATSTESVPTQEPGTEEPAGDQNPIVETETAIPSEDALKQSGEEETVEILVGLSKRISPDEHFPKDEGWTFKESPELGKLNIYILNVPTSKQQEEIQRLRNLPGVNFVEPNYWLEATDTIPNDPGFSSQYALTAIRAPQGWDISTGSATVTIAIVDSGVDYGHAELAGKLVPGYDFVFDDNIADDQTGHGTHVAGIAAASSNNGLGIAGVSWRARIMPVRVLNAINSGSYANTAAGIIWATDHGAQIINLSLGGSNPSTTLETAVNYAAGSGALVIASSGNNGANYVLYPARYSAAMAVAATDASNQRASFSNYGPEIDIAAPGAFIYSLALGGYSTRSGTSMAAPHVSGLAAVLWDMPGNGSAANVRWSIESTALDIELPGWDPYSGAGLIQMDAALGAPPAPTATNTSTATSTPIVTFTATASEALKPSPQVPFTQPGYISPPGDSPTWTPLPAGAATLTFTPTSTATATSTASPTATEVALNTPAPEGEVTAQDAIENGWLERLKVFLSPLFCGGMLLILAGLVWGWMMRRRKENRVRSKLKLELTKN